MKATFTLGRIGGVRIGLDWSWVVILALVVWSLAGSAFPSTNPGLSSGAYVGMAVVAAVLFFASLLLHELGHALQARREGVDVDSVTLWLFGGVARLRGELPSAGAEFRIGIAGPVVTLGIGSLCVAVAAALPGPAVVDGVVAWLGYINFVLLAFNLLPALPLDGGRVLRSALWAGRHDLESATRTAVRVSHGFAFVLIGGGLALFLAGGGVSALWLAFVGWFLFQAAIAEARRLVLRRALGALCVRDLMEPDPVVADADETLAEFADETSGRPQFTTYPVVRAGEAVGLLPLARVLAVPWSDWARRRVGESMIPRADAPVFTEDEAALSALDTLAGSAVGRGLVVDGERLAGLLSITDISRLLPSPR